MADGKVNRYVWDGNLLLHEWSYNATDRPRLVVQEHGQLRYDRKERVENIVTWVYDNNSFTPSAKLVGGKQYSIITDYLGTPVEAYDERGNKVWYRELNCYGQVRKGDNEFVPFLYQGQYWDEETGLAYNRFRYYSPNEGMYISKDPIGLAGGKELYGYVRDVNAWVDVLGLAPGIGGIVLAGNATSPSTVRPGRDVIVDENGIIKSQAGVERPMGKSAFDTPENMGNVLSDTHVHQVNPTATLPEGLAIKFDGKDVEGGYMSKGHRTIYNTRDMTPEEFDNKTKGMESERIGKLDKNGKFKYK